MRQSKRKHSSRIITGVYSQKGNYGTRDTDEESEESESDDREYEVENILSTRINDVGFFLKVNTRLIINQLLGYRTTRMGSQMDGVCQNNLAMS